MDINRTSEPAGCRKILRDLFRRPWETELLESGEDGSVVYPIPFWK